MEVRGKRCRNSSRTMDIRGSRGKSMRVSMMRVWPWWAGILVHCLLSVGLAAGLTDSETRAMQQLRTDLHVHQSAWPSIGDPCTSWQGVQCVNNHVDSIQLSGLPREQNQTLQFALDSLQSLPNLRELNASGFLLPGSIPDWFGNLRALETLDFTLTSLFGTIPGSFGRLSSLKFLSLAENKLSGNIPQSLGNIVNLTSLNLSLNKIMGPIPTSLFNAPNLTALDLSQNNLTGQIPTAVGKVVNLQTLFLSNNELSGLLLPQLGNLSLLTQLDLSSNFLSGPIPADFGNLKNLITLNVGRNNLSGEIPSEISQCAALQSLLLSSNRLAGVIPDSIGNLRNLLALDLSFNQLSATLPLGLTTFMLLQRLDLSHNLFYGQILSQFANLQNLQLLNFSNNFFNGSEPMGLIPGTNVRKNCLSVVPNQHNLRTCAKFYRRKGLAFGTPPLIPSPTRSPTPLPAEAAPVTSGNKKTRHLVPILAGVIGGLGLILVVAALVFCLHRFERSREVRTANSPESGRGGSARVTGAIAVTASRMGEVFSYSQLQQATKKFSVSNLITNGHSGDLYKGVLEGGATVALKRIDLNKVRMESYLQELEVLSRASHTRLVLLLGHCLDRDDEKFLVYKYTPNGDLASALHKRGSPGPCEDVLQSLDWITRLKIAIGVAEALAYLHSECSPPIVHRDVKASSILLDDKFEVRLGSLSDARVQDGDSHPSRITRLLGLSQSSDQGDPGAMATCSYDVYCFGKVLLELVSGKLGISGATDPRAEAWLEWALPLINVHDKESLPKLVDPSLIVDEDLLEEVWAMAIIARACLNAKPSKRPSMRHVLKALENPHKVVREENFGESLAMRTSSHSSWNEALFGSWRHNNNNNNVAPSGLREDAYHGSLPVAKASGVASTSGYRGDALQGQHARRGSSDIVPEPIDEETLPGSQ